MGRRGPLPMDPETQRLRGNPSKRPIPAPDARLGGQLSEIPAPPRWLGPVGAAEWHHMATELIAVGTLTSGDIGNLTGYAVACLRLHDAESELAKLGTLTVAGSTGSLVMHPLAREARQAADRMRKFSIELRAKPASRVRKSDQPLPPGGKRKFAGLIAGLDFDANVPPWERWRNNNKQKPRVKRDPSW